MRWSRSFFFCSIVLLVVVVVVVASRECACGSSLRARISVCVHVSILQSQVGTLYAPHTHTQTHTSWHCKPRLSQRARHPFTVLFPKPPPPPPPPFPRTQSCERDKHAYQLCGGNFAYINRAPKFPAKCSACTHAHTHTRARNTQPPPSSSSSSSSRSHPWHKILRGCVLARIARVCVRWLPHTCKTRRVEWAVCVSCRGHCSFPRSGAQDVAGLVQTIEVCCVEEYIKTICFVHCSTRTASATKP